MRTRTGFAVHTDESYKLPAIVRIPGGSFPRVRNEREIVNAGSRFGANGRYNFFLFRRGCRFIHKFFPIATFLDASANFADFGVLLDGEIGATFGAGLGEWLKRCSEIAIRIARTAIEDARATAASHAATANKFAFVTFGAFDAEGDGPRIFAVGVAGAADEFAVASVFFHETFSASGAFFVKRFVGLKSNARALDKT